MRIAASVVVCSLACLACAPAPSATLEPVAEPTAEVAAPVEADGARPTGLIDLHPIALREGPVRLAWTGGDPYLILDGEPVALRPGAAPTREPRLGAGLAPRSSYGGSFELVDLALTADAREGAVVVREDYDRAGSEHHVYTLGPAGWRPRVVAPRGHLHEIVGAVAEGPGGTLFGVREHELGPLHLYDLDVTDESEESERFWREVEDQRRTAPGGLVALVGSTPPPELPSGWIVSDLATAGDGRLVALARQDRGDDGLGPQRVLHWGPGQTAPSVDALPESEPDAVASDELRLWPAGDAVLVTGYESYEEQPSRPYLAKLDGSGWAQIPVEIAGAAGFDMYIRSAALVDGEPWIAVEAWGDADFEQLPTLWRRSGEQWQPVLLPSVDAALAAADRQERWAFDPTQHEWVFVAADDEPEPVVARARELISVDGVVWIVADLGRAYPTSNEIYADEPRSVVFASAPLAGSQGGQAGPAWLPGFDTVHLERLDAQVVASGATPGKQCGHVTFVLLDDADARADQREAMLAALAAAGELPTADDGDVRWLYLGSPLDQPARTQLVADAYVESAAAAKQLAAGLRQRTGAPVTADCRPRLMRAPIE